ncbi:MAG: flagellar biosynthesis protein FlhF [Phycisphaerales bacterium]|nr:flagellar biosynthesis protein FlhF [Phycisphaerales bacterium]
MKLKTYRAQSMADALAQVKKDLGKDAIILHTRMFKAGGFMGFGAKEMVEVIASDDARVASTIRLKDKSAASGATSGVGKAASRSANEAATHRASVEAGQDERAALLLGAARARAERQMPLKAGAGSLASASAPSGQLPVAQGVGGGNGQNGVPFYPAAGPVRSSTASVRAALAEREDLLPPETMTVKAVSSAGGGGAGSLSMGGRGVLRSDDDQASPVRQAARMAIDPATGLSEQVQAELAVIRRMVGQVLQSSAKSAVGVAACVPGLRMSDALLKHYTRLIENEVAQELADEIIAGVRDELTPAELADESTVRAAVLRRLETLLTVDQQVAAPPTKAADGRPLTIALIGPTGVGKTTTIAKLAAAYRLRHGKKVALITSDTYRIAAVDQLRTYANIIGVPLRVVHTPAEMQAAVEATRDADVVLIDTAGRSPGDAQRVGELRTFLQAAKPHQTHLVLSSVASEGALMRSAERFGDLKPNLVIFTKLDEAANLGVLVNVARRIDAKLSYVTTGQEVPDDIEPSRPERLARLVLDGKAG